VQLTGLILLCVFLSAGLTGWALQRFGFRSGKWLSLLNGMVARLAAGVLLTLTAVRAVQRGGVWFAALAVAMGALALGLFTVVWLLAWGLLKYGTDD